MSEPTWRDALRAMMPTWKLAAILTILTVCAVAPSWIWLFAAQGDLTLAADDNLAMFLAPDDVVEVPLDATVPVRGPGQIWLDATTGTCKPGVCLPTGDCAGPCVSQFQKRPGDRLGPGVYAWKGTCNVGAPCQPFGGEGQNTAEITTSGVCSCVYDSQACAPDYQWVGTKKKPDGSDKYLVTVLPQPAIEAEACQ